MPDGQNYDYKTDPEFLKANPIQMNAYLRSVDPDFAKADPKDQAAYINHIKGWDQPTQFEKDRPGKGITSEGMGSAAWQTTKALGSGLLGLADPTRGLTGAGLTKLGLNPRKGTVSERLGEVPIVAAGREVKSAYNDPNTKWWEVPAAGLGSMAGVSAEQQRALAARGEGGQILGQSVVPATAAIGGPLASEALPKMRPALQRAAYKELPTGGAPQLTRGARLTGSLLGAGTGAAIGEMLGGGPGVYAGGHAGLLLGPSALEKIIGTPELGDIRNPGPFSKIPMRAPKINTRPFAEPSPFEGMTSSANPPATQLPPPSARTSVLGASPAQPTIEMVKKFTTPETPKSRIIQPGSEAAAPPHVEGSYWSFGEQALRKAVMGGDRDAAIVYKQRFGELPPGARYLTDVAQGPTRGLYRSEK